MSLATRLSPWLGRRIRLSPSLRIAVGLVSLLMGWLVVLDMVFKVLPDSRATTQQLREQVAIHLAMQVRRSLVEPGMAPLIANTFQDLVDHSADLESVGLRRADGSLLAQTPFHASRWREPASGQSTLDHVVIPLNSGAGRWGQLEVGFRASSIDTWMGWIWQPAVQWIVLLALGTFLAFYLFLRRVLQHLDPSNAIPERVRVAFDTLTEGLLVLDVKGQVLMANSAFRAFHPDAGHVLLGRSIEQMVWLVEGLRETGEALPPWQRVLLTSEPIMGVPIDLGVQHGEPRRALLNCAAIRDASGISRGCLVTLDDITELDRANARLRSTMAELQVSQVRIQKQNDELQTLANCDPLTGCFNRRAFFTRADPMLAHAQATGEPLSCLMADIDKFKVFNDTHGHAVGDLVIQQVAQVLKQAMGPRDVLCRYGGEEFCVLLAGRDLEQAADVAESIRRAVETQAGPAIEEVGGLHITCSLGVAQWGVGRADLLPQLIERADQGLYAAKAAGRNQVQSPDWAVVDAVAV